MDTIKQLQDDDIIRVCRTRRGEADAFIERSAMRDSRGWNRALPRQGLHPTGRVPFDFGPELTDGCYNLAYSMLWACCPLDAGYWHRWFAQMVLEPETGDRWEITAGEVRELIEDAERFYGRRSRPARMRPAAMTSCTVGGGTLTSDEV